MADASPTRRGTDPGHGDASATLLVILLAVVTAGTAELVRMSGPLIDRAFTAGVVPAAVTAVGTYAAAGALLLALCLRRPIDGRVLLFGVLALSIARLACQGLTGTLRFGVGLATVALSVAVLVLVAAVCARISGRAVAAGISGGLALSATLNLALGTWDAVWRPGPLGWLAPVLLALGGSALAVRLRGLPAAPAGRGLWLLGPYVGLAVMTFANPAFVTSQSGIPLWTSAWVVIAGAVVTCLALARSVPAAPRLPRWSDAVLVIGLGGLTACVFYTVGWPGSPGPVPTALVLGALVALSVAAPSTLARALTRPQHPQLPWRLSGAASCTGLGIILPLLVYQLDYDVPLGTSNAIVPVAVAVLLAAMAVRSRHRARAFTGELSAAAVPLRAQAPFVAVATALALVGAVLAVPVGAAAAVDAAPGRLRLISWNLHYGVSAEPSVDLDEIAAVIRDSGADVAALQEVSRGWVMGGGADMASYLAQELGMDFVFVPAADRQFGNVLLWKSYLGEADDVELIALPYGQGPQRRSAVSATFDAGGVPVRVTSIHLQHRLENIDTRLDQLRTLVSADPVEGNYVLAGDLNAEPGWPEPRFLLDAGLHSAQDESGDARALTFPSGSPESRIDWIFGSGVTFSETSVIDTTQSDHRPLVTTFTVDPAPN